MAVAYEKFEAERLAVGLDLGGTPVTYAPYHEGHVLPHEASQGHRY